MYIINFTCDLLSCRGLLFEHICLVNWDDEIKNLWKGLSYKLSNSVIVNLFPGCLRLGRITSLFANFCFQNDQNGVSEAHSSYCWALAAKVSKMMLLRLILVRSGPRPAKCSKWACWDPFWLYLGPWRQSVQNEFPKEHSGRVWAQAAKVFKINFLRPIVAMCWSRPPKCSKWICWGTFWR